MWFYLIITLAFLAYWALSRKFNYWKQKGVPSPPASILFGNLGQSVTLSKSLLQIYSDIYDEYPGYRYVGYYKARQPGIVLRDPELIKEITIKEFSSFHDTDFFIDESVDPVGAKNPFTLKGQKWKTVRNQITPAFTSSKIKSMYSLVSGTLKRMKEYLESHPAATGEGFDAKLLCGKYTTDVVANVAFGLEGRSFEDENNEFRRMGMKVFKPSTITALKALIVFMFPSLATTFRVGLFTKDILDYFRAIMKATIKFRLDNGLVRNDFLDLMLELKTKPGEYEFTDEDVLAHAMGFFVDGFETSSTAMCFMLYDLATNPETQEKLLEEIKSTMEKNPELNYEIISQIPYLEAVVNESLRMHPPGLALTRTCTKPFTLPPPRGNGSPVQIEKGTPIIIPIYGLHHDPQHFPDPEKYDPERFLGKNKESRPKSVYLPFGDGPRACLGQRYAIMQLKIGIVHIVANFEIKLNNRTKLPLEIDPTALIPYAKGGIWLNFHKR